DPTVVGRGAVADSIVELQVGVAVVTLVPDGHVHQHPRDVAFHLVPRLERIVVGVVVRGAVHGGATVVEVLVAADSVHLHVGGAQVVQVGARTGGAEAPVGFGPHVFPVPITDVAAVGVLRTGLAAVEEDDVVRIRRVLVRGSDPVPDLAVGQLL